MATDYFERFRPYERGVKRVIRASRGAAKTTLFVLADTLHRVLYATEPYTVLMSSTQPLSVDKIKDIQSELLANDKIAEYFRLRLPKRMGSEKFTIQTAFGESTLKAQSFFSQIRGLKKGAVRPSRMVFDDVTHGERVFSEVQREKAKRQFYTDIRNAGHPGTSYIFLGTTIHADDLLTKLSKEPLWDAYLYKAIEKWPENMGLWVEWEKILSNRQNPNREADAQAFYVEHQKDIERGAKVLWPEREPLIYLMKERFDIGKRAFGAEKQMEPFLTGDRLFEKIHWFQFKEKDGKKGFFIEETGQFLPEDDERWQIFYALDPATGEKKKQTSKKSLSFSSRIIVYRNIKTNQKFVLRDRTNRDSPTEIIKEMIRWHEQYLFLKVGVEGDLFKDLYLPAVKMLAKEHQSKTGHYERIPFYEIFQDQKKEKRIYSIEPKVHSGEILFCRDLSVEATGELENYPNCDHNDFLDAVEIAEKITNARYSIKATHISLG